MKKHGILRLLCAVLCAAALLGCAERGPDTDSTASGLPAEPQEIFEGGYYAASPDKVYHFEDDRPVFSLERVYYDDPILIELKTAQPAAIYYTTDGTDPDEHDTLYEDGIYITPNRADFPKPITVCARAYYADGTVSEPAMRTYFCTRNVTERFTTAVFVITGDPEDLTEGPDGIFYGENYKYRGDDTEREVFIECFDDTGSREFAQYSGIRIYGGASRASSIKSTKIYARKRYSSGIGKFNTDLFGTTDSEGNIIAEYDKLVLRNCGNDFQFGFIRDELCQRLAQQAGYDDYEAVKPAVVYLNGEYYGFFWLHESYCDDYFKNKYPNADAQGEFVVIEGNENWKNEEEDGGKEQQAQQYNEFYQTYAWADLTVEETYQQLRREMDVENYLDYFAFNIYINNNDWPQNNFKCYRYVPADREQLEGVYDGRWRYVLHDTDFSLNMYGFKETSATYNNLSQIVDSSSDRYAPLFDALMHRTDCREYFMKKLTELGEGVFSGENVTRVLYEMHIERCTEMDYLYIHMDALRKAGDDSFWTSVHTLTENMDAIRAFANDRDDYILPLAEKTMKKYE